MSFALAPFPVEVYWASGVTVAAALYVAVRRAARRPPPVRSLRERVEGVDGGPPDEDIDRALHWLPPDPGASDRRKSVRRGGPVTPVRVARTPGGHAEEGVVVDRSTGGLCLALDRLYQDGSTLFVRPDVATADCPWVAVTVRHCRGCRDYHLAGVEFPAPPPWNVLLQFG